jgi:hypothetical protein
MYDIHRLGRIKLAKGGHNKINANGELCVNEAAILAAGFDHRKVRQACDCPSCFSRVIAQYAIILNDRMPDDLRNELLTPFILRLAGTADRPAVELRRLTFIVLQSMRKTNSYFFRQVMGHPDLAEQCEKVETIPEAWLAAKRIIRDLPSDFLLGDFYSTAIAECFGDSPAARTLEGTYMRDRPASDTLTRDTAAMRGMHIVICGVAYAWSELTSSAGQRDLFTMATDILDQAIMMGNHPVDYGDRGQTGVLAFRQSILPKKAADPFGPAALGALGRPSPQLLGLRPAPQPTPRRSSTVKRLTSF